MEILVGTKVFDAIQPFLKNLPKKEEVESSWSVDCRLLLFFFVSARRLVRRVVPFVSESSCVSHRR